MDVREPLFSAQVIFHVCIMDFEDWVIVCYQSVLQSTNLPLPRFVMHVFLHVKHIVKLIWCAIYSLYLDKWKLAREIVLSVLIPQLNARGHWITCARILNLTKTLSLLFSFSLLLSWSQSLGSCWQVAPLKFSHHVFCCWKAVFLC